MQKERRPRRREESLESVFFTALSYCSHARELAQLLPRIVATVGDFKWQHLSMTLNGLGCKSWPCASWPHGLTRRRASAGQPGKRHHPSRERETFALSCSSPLERRRAARGLLEGNAQTASRRHGGCVGVSCLSEINLRLFSPPRAGSAVRRAETRAFSSGTFSSQCVLCSALLCAAQATTNSIHAFAGFGFRSADLVQCV